MGMFSYHSTFAQTLGSDSGSWRTSGTIISTPDRVKTLDVKPCTLAAVLLNDSCTLAAVVSSSCFSTGLGFDNYALIASIPVSDMRGVQNVIFAYMGYLA